MSDVSRADKACAAPTGVSTASGSSGPLATLAPGTCLRHPLCRMPGTDRRCYLRLPLNRMPGTHHRCYLRPSICRMPGTDRGYYATHPLRLLHRKLPLH
eukprot:2197624-Rhodomonas_salina.2